MLEGNTMYGKDFRGNLYLFHCLLIFFFFFRLLPPFFFFYKYQWVQANICVFLYRNQYVGFSLDMHEFVKRWRQYMPHLSYRCMCIHMRPYTHIQTGHPQVSTGFRSNHLVVIRP